MYLTDPTLKGPYFIGTRGTVDRGGSSRRDLRGDQNVHPTLIECPPVVMSGSSQTPLFIVSKRLENKGRSLKVKKVRCDTDVSRSEQ